MTRVHATPRTSPRVRMVKARCRRVIALLPAQATSEARAARALSELDRASLDLQAELAELKRVRA